MLDYMQALRERFVGECDRERRQAIHNLRKEISQGIRKEYRRKLLRLVDLEAALREEYALENFLAGFKLAWGLSRELGDPYDYRKDMGRRSIEQLRKEAR